MKTVFFDFDGVLTPRTHGMELALMSGRGEEIKKIFSSFSKSKTGVEWAVYQGISHFKGIEEEKLFLTASSLPFSRNAESSVTKLREAGYVPVILTNGIKEIAEIFGKRLGIEEAYGNSLEVINGKLTGRFSESRLLTIKSKGRFVKRYMREKKLGKGEVAAVGNDENDWAMFCECGFSILFNPSLRLLEKIEKSMKEAELGRKKEFHEVLRRINVVVKEDDLSFILPFLIPSITMFPEKMKIKKSKYI